MATEARETASLIGSDKVEGTAVYGRDEERIGSIERVMIDKQSGKVAYAVIAYGGFLGIGDDHYPTPWSSLKYDTRLGGYVVGITADALKDAPRYGNEVPHRQMLNEFAQSDAAGVGAHRHAELGRHQDHREVLVDAAEPAAVDLTV